MTDAKKTEEEYAAFRAERKQYVDKILNSRARKKIVVAGPGTGKTYLFKKILKDKKKSLTLTFVNTLLEDLALELCGQSDVRTLHGFALSALPSTNGKRVEIFPKLSRIIREDAKLLLDTDIDFKKIFHNLESEDAHIKFYKKRKDFYGNYYGFTDIIYAIVSYFEAHREKIPKFDQVVVDEYQDFNKLEVSLIDLLAGKSPILLAGDDDQALYDFKSASAQYIRDRYSDADAEYESFVLPFCSRCTRVVVHAANDILSAASEIGCLEGRIEKPYLYFENLEKDKISAENKTLVHTQAHAIPYFIEHRIKEIAETERQHFEVLILSPNRMLSQKIVEGLCGKGFQNIEPMPPKPPEDPTIMDGLKLLLNKDTKCNLGWRIISKILLTQENFEFLLRESETDLQESLFSLLDVKHQKKVRKILTGLRRIRDKKAPDPEILDEIIKLAGVNPREMATASVKNEIGEITSGDPSVRKIPIKAKTIESSKGLSADYVFITHFDDGLFISDQNNAIPSDRDIWKFVVALTRAKRKVFLISSDNKDPTFLKWIKNERIERI